MILIMSLVLCGVLALSVPTFAEKGQQASKTAVTTVNVTVVKTSTLTSAPKSESVRSGWKEGLRFWLRSWLGLPWTDSKPSTGEGPQKSSTDPNTPRWMDAEPIRDHGGEESF